MIYELEDVCFTYPLNSRLILNSVSLGVAEGETLSILGPNGAGKSTLLNCMGGLLKPTKGCIKLQGTDISTLSFRDIARTVGYVPQTHVPSFDYTVAQFVLMGRAPNIGTFQKPKEEDKEIAMEAIKSLSLEHLADRPYTDISGGERQLATIARALAQQPSVILFDEPTAHLDYGNQYRILRLICSLAARGYSIVFTTHNPDHALLVGGRTAVIDKRGVLVSGTCSEIITEERLKDIYQADLRLLYIEEIKRRACLTLNLAEGEKNEM